MKMSSTSSHFLETGMEQTGDVIRVGVAFGYVRVADNT